jgi:hypothetical protein
MALAGDPITPGFAAPMLLMSGLAVIAAAGERIAVHRQRIVGVAWAAMLLAPPLAAIVAFVVVPWLGLMDLSSREPASAMARFFGDTYQRRLNRPPQTIVGDTRLAYVLAAAMPSRPQVFNAAAPWRTPWRDERGVRTHGAIVVWQLTDPTGAAPAEIRTRFPELIAEVPQSFARPIEGLQPTLRVGWGLIRPQGNSASR